MGQRLTIEIKNKDKSLACAYYHWSGYTDSSLQILNLFMEAYSLLKDKNEISDQYKAVIALRATGAGLIENPNDVLDSTDIPEEIYFEDEEILDRNAGLIYISNDNIEDALYWSEGPITIDLESETICFEVVRYEDAEAFKEERELQELKLYKINFDPDSVPFESYKEFINEMRDALEDIRNNRYDTLIETPSGDTLCVIE